MKVTIWRPNKDSVHNPLYNSELRNKPCVCNSGKKVKKCCGQDPYILKKKKEMLECIYRGDTKRAQQLNEELQNIGDKNDTTGRSTEESGERES